jgi:chromosomal replication initiator protein
MYQAHYLTDKGIKTYLRTIDMEAQKHHIKLHLNHEKHIENICRLVFNYFDVPIEKIKVRNRQAQIIRAKQFTAYFLRREVYSITLSEIGKLFNLDHATAIHSINKIKGVIEVDKEYRNYHEELCGKMMELYR